MKKANAPLVREAAAAALSEELEKIGVKGWTGKDVYEELGDQGATQYKVELEYSAGSSSDPMSNHTGNSSDPVKVPVRASALAE